MQGKATDWEGDHVRSLSTRQVWITGELVGAKAEQLVSGSPGGLSDPGFAFWEAGG